MGLQKLEITTKKGNEKFIFDGKELLLDVFSFWQWSSSDLLGNTLRGILAEFIVASSLGYLNKPRQEWDAYDIKTPEGIKVEVKSSAYIQTWSQKDYSKITFGIAKKKAWDAETNETSAEKKRHADIYVFCVLAHKNKATINPLDLCQWDFYVIPRKVLDTHCGEQKNIGLSKLMKLPLIVKTEYDELKNVIKDMAHNDFLVPTAPAWECIPRRSSVK